MNFIEFLDFSQLKNSVSVKTDYKGQIIKNTDGNKKKKTIDKLNNKNVNKEKNIPKEENDTLNNENDMMVTCNNIKKGDYVSIIHNKNSIYNYYKGYIGEIMEYNKMGSFAVVSLLGLSQFKTIKLPVTHFIKRTNVA
jgi:hypothetical protein